MIFFSSFLLGAGFVFTSGLVRGGIIFGLVLSLSWNSARVRSSSGSTGFGAGEVGNFGF